MKIQALHKSTNQPLANTKIQLLVKGKDSGYQSFVTDANGYFQLEDKYNGQQFALSTTPDQYITAKEGAKLLIDSKDIKNKTGYKPYEQAKN